MKLLEELNNSQKEAVSYINGPSMVIAGAGSGKTRVLTYKIAYLLKKGYYPENILALTFTNKAAKEMKSRIAKMLDYQTANRLWMGTFHSIFSKILRKEAELLGFTSDFTIYDGSDTKSLLKSIIKELGLDEKNYKVSTVLSKISFAKNNLINPMSYAQNTEILKYDETNKMGLVKDIYSIYWSRCKQANAMDFDDLLLYTNILFRDFPLVLEKYQDIFQYILVDEYQDTNFSQHLIIKKLSEIHQKICVVGDDAQSIYSFRGANIENILGFKDTYKDCQIFKLEQNYRSTKNIVNAANSLILKNKSQIQKKVFSEKDKGSLIKIIPSFSDLEEASIVANYILDLKKQYETDEIAVLYRTNAQSRVFEEAFRKNKIPYKIYGGVSFYQRKEIKDILAYLRLSINYNDEEALKRIINYPARGIGNVTLSKVKQTAIDNNITLWEVLSNIEQYDIQLNQGAINRLSSFTDAIAYFHQLSINKNAYEVSDEVIKKSGIWLDVSAEKTVENLSKQENIQELLSAMHDFCNIDEEENAEKDISIAAFLSEVSLLTDQDQEEEEDTKKVTLMTVHASKGLEFKNIFIVGMEEDLFPSSRSLMFQKDLEEERRLFYVALTRAEENCFISYAKTRFRNGQNNFCNPSRFLKDIDEEYLDLSAFQNSSHTYIVNNDNKKLNFKQQNISKPKRLLSLNEISTQSKQQQVEINGLKVGSKIKHDRFGVGEVLELEDDNNNLKAWVIFEDNKKRQLLLKFAKFTILT